MRPAFFLRAAARLAGALLPLAITAHAGAQPALRPVPFSALPGWAEDRHAEALPALLASCDAIRGDQPGRMLGGEPGIAERAGNPVAWQEVCREARALALSLPSATDVAAQRRHTAVRLFLERRFDPMAAGTGLLTGYYEPELRGALTPDETFATPLLARPPDLVEIKEAGGSGRPRFGVMRDGRLEPFHDRAAIENGALAGRGLELAWVDDPIAAFFLQVQGSGRVVLPGGAVLRLGYAGRNGHPYVPVGRVLIERGEIPRDRMSMQAIRDWLRAAGPRRAAELLRQNPSYIFFRRVEGLRPDQGPIGALGAPLTPGRSIAVDRAFVPLGVPGFIAARDPVTGEPMNRLVVAQDTGSAIRGPARADLFWGWGPDAEERAGRMQETAALFVLLPRPPETTGTAP